MKIFMEECMAQFQIDEDNSIFYNYTEPTNPDGVTWVFFNALTGDTQMWETVIGKRLRAEGHGTLSFNFRGQTDSTFKEDCVLDSVLIVKDSCDLLRDLAPKRVMLCGLSIGGLFAIQSWLAGLSNVNAVGLVLINTLRRDGQRLRWINDALVRCAEVGGLQLFRDMFVPLLFNEEWQGVNRDKFLQPQKYIPLKATDGHYNLLKNAGSADWNQPYDQLNLPVLIITGLQDHIFLDLDDVENIYERLPNARHEKMSNAGHMIPAERPDELVDSLLAFVNEVSE